MTDLVAVTAPGDPYCGHPGCHDPRTRVYADGGVTGSSATNWSQVRPPKLIYLDGVGDGLPGERRWCRIHALMFEGVA